ncbi:cytidine deaminase [Haloglomus litoreum]|uniref:cytidine deaminase n=1 Tax=Haloglomus litoreum TaxID=3034026 RepID=UPI0023E7CD62|nr:cytidine deaminase [Haloglomus sp. DT116]
MVTDEELVAAAREACERAYAPYSGYDVGAALLARDGTVFRGCNVEMITFTNTIHAESGALGAAVAAGHREFDAVAVASGERDGVTPCGLCRQTLAELCDDDLRVLCDVGDGIKEWTLGELLPGAMSGDEVEHQR